MDTLKLEQVDIVTQRLLYGCSNRIISSVFCYRIWLVQPDLCVGRPRRFFRAFFYVLPRQIQLSLIINVKFPVQLWMRDVAPSKSHNLDTDLVRKETDQLLRPVILISLSLCPAKVIDVATIEKPLCRKARKFV